MKSRIATAWEAIAPLLFWALMGSAVFCLADLLAVLPGDIR